jgi:hypothetical protein
MCTYCLRANENPRPLRCLIFRGSIPRPVQSLCTLRNHCCQWPRNTRYQADATPPCRQELRRRRRGERGSRRNLAFEVFLARSLSRIGSNADSMFGTFQCDPEGLLNALGYRSCLHEPGLVEPSAWGESTVRLLRVITASVPTSDRAANCLSLESRMVRWPFFCNLPAAAQSGSPGPS